MDFSPTPEMLTRLRIENLLQPETLTQIPKSRWPRTLPGLIEVWRSKRFLVQVYSEVGGIERLSVCRTDVDETSANWQAGISWDELQQVKRECGLAEKDAVEIFPRDADVVSVANMRHLWVMPGKLAFAWRKQTVTGAHRRA